jgi:hypothetical protein
MLGKEQCLDILKRLVFLAVILFTILLMGACGQMNPPKDNQSLATSNDRRDRAYHNMLREVFGSPVPSRPSSPHSSLVDDDYDYYFYTAEDVRRWPWMADPPSPLTPCTSALSTSHSEASVDDSADEK